ncbi:dihydroorotate dehydrogenase PyrD [Sulfurisphaera ohwakuensis]|uniref:Dihydroorotate dehydrogenase n=1 Tax=Sulfurisphaera ohwakuensis TaxID=69656 RepID=A0A650CHF9_SULOH|nr:dihydroorotate dehydrogenase PyrD [Sulfurisphaera ohwakuensis]MBB5252352.1 dihydroorotate dehydrogenase (fumarate) [Sulfurisphaera ohwakuensis]QGR17188.1 dihydroorotate dehydrogenase [Sulfurisphaera ohwakuensis]
MINLAGIQFKDPIIISSGIVTLSKIQEVCKNYLPSAITTKTLTLKPLNPHDPPTLVKFHDKCYLNAIGLGNPGIDELKKINEEECKLIVSVGGSSIDEIMEVIKRVDRGEIIELNLSSPNRKGYGESLASYVYEVVKNVKGVTNKPVFVKLGPWDNIIESAGRAISAGADGLSLINTVKGMVIDVETFKKVMHYGTGGISGKCIHPLAVRIIHDVYKEYNVDIIGMGGVFSGIDAIELMSVGAKLIGLGTVIIDEGYSSIIRIRKEMEEYLKEKGLKYSDIIGVAVKK